MRNRTLSCALAATFAAVLPAADIAEAQVHVGVGRDAHGNRQVQVFVGRFGIPLVDVNVNSGRGVDVSVGDRGVSVPISGPALPAPRAQATEPLPAPGSEDVDLGEPSTDAAAPAENDGRPDPPPVPMQTVNYLGVYTEPLPAALAAQLVDALPENGGLLVTKVYPDTPAATAKLKANDILLAFDGEPLTSHDQLRTLVQDAAPAATVKLEILRAGKREDLELTLARRDIEVRPERPEAAENAPAARLEDRPPEPATSALSAEPAPVAAVAPAAEATVQRGPNTVSVATFDGVTYHVAVSFSDAAGQRRQLELVGTQQEIVRQFHALPPAVQRDIVRSFY